jgi:hypothetical protein
MEKIRIRDPGWKKVGSGRNILDLQHLIFAKIITVTSTSGLAARAAAAPLRPRDSRVLYPPRLGQAAL